MKRRVRHKVIRPSKKKSIPVVDPGVGGPEYAEYTGEENIRDDSHYLIPALGMAEEILVYQVGADKHGAESWRDGMPWHRCLAKINRHLGRFLQGESRDMEDGQHHLASVKFWCNTLMEYEQTHPELNDITL